MTYDDLKAVAGLVQDADQKERMQEIANELAVGTLRGELSAHWSLPLDEISYITLLEDQNDVINGDSITNASMFY